MKEIDQVEFEKLCALQCTKAEIAGFFNVSEDTVERWCKRTYEESFAVVFANKRSGGKISLRRSQFLLAEKDSRMAIWLGKQYLGQCEPMEVKRLELELQKFESKLNEQWQEADLDDSMLDALNSAAVEVWGGGDDGGTSDGCTGKEDSS
nr:helix-turn-helix domain-containing protein [uncultured Schaedlerella sp.]